jgi:hypothetical protein
VNFYMNQRQTRKGFVNCLRGPLRQCARRQRARKIRNRCEYIFKGQHRLTMCKGRERPTRQRAKQIESLQPLCPSRDSGGVIEKKRERDVTQFYINCH